MLIVFICIAGCSGCGQKTAQQVPIDAPQEAESKHQHRTPDISKPSAPENDVFFKSIVFPDAPYTDEFGHPRPPYPFQTPDVVKNNPHLFSMDAEGRWEPIYSKELIRKCDDVRAQGLPDKVYGRKLGEVIAEGLDPLPAAMLVARHGIASVEVAKELIDKALVQKPNAFDTMEYWCTLHKSDKPKAAEATYRRMLEMRPNDISTLYRLGRIILRHEEKPIEAISYLEKAYKLKPDWYGPIYTLGEVYFKLHEFEKALRYYEASEKFTGPADGSSMSIAAIRRYLTKQKKEKGVVIQ